MNSLRSFASAITAALMALSSLPVIGDGYGGRGFSAADLRGCFDFRFNGHLLLDSGVFVPVAAVGILTEPTLLPEGKGCYEEEGEIEKRGIRTLSSALGVIEDQKFTCCITLGPDGRGSARCPLDAPLPGFRKEENFDAALSRAGGVRTFFLTGTDPGVVITGEGRSQTNFPWACQEVEVNGDGGGSIL